MGLTKKTPQQLSAVANGPNTNKGVENIPRKSREPVNHWAILDEIEAPMWVDLTLECDSTYEDKDDEWFHISHPFHQSSARRQLISSFYHSVEHRMNSAFDVRGPCSPKLPSSVSKSGGEDYKRSEKATKNNAFDGKVYEHLNYMSDSVDESTLPGTTAQVFPKSVSSFSDKKTSAKSVSFGGGESNSTCTITSEATAGKLIEASSQPFGSTSGLLSNLRDSLRKSYVTRQASRVEIKGMRQSEGWKSSSSKSSAGSSSHPGCDGMNLMVTENMDKTPDSRNIMTVSQLPINKVNRANVHKAPAAQAQNMSCKSDLCINREASKTMDHKKHTEGYVTRKVNKSVPLAIAKNSTRVRGIKHSSRTVDGGKENQSGKMALAIKSSTKMKETEGPLQDLKVVKRKVHQTSHRSKLDGQRENFSSGSKVKKSIRMVETVYFR
ncbi:hypothetical protein Pfo_014177 [Paulownia fortunei]|nr:hypothetical protein Pfo_014177 [Paulownia fortunei]